MDPNDEDSRLVKHTPGGVNTVGIGRILFTVLLVAGASLGTFLSLFEIEESEANVPSSTPATLEWPTAEAPPVLLTSAEIEVLAICHGVHEWSVEADPSGGDPAMLELFRTVAAHIPAEQWLEIDGFAVSYANKVTTVQAETRVRQLGGIGDSDEALIYTGMSPSDYLSRCGEIIRTRFPDLAAKYIARSKQ